MIGPPLSIELEEEMYNSIWWSSFYARITGIASKFVNKCLSLLALDEILQKLHYTGYPAFLEYATAAVQLYKNKSY